MGFKIGMKRQENNESHHLNELMMNNTQSVMVNDSFFSTEIPVEARITKRQQ